ncbi:uncharacterized protein LOC124160585 [Ischnura elegans]|uniref:uncharacterized protein LOC124160585 n=1 Tax=Ischnura elegans TaxID=197161 RepID=UPI001ED8700D|nr:uncharacterized protein LOC124160585 [Ischnura elegans]XP_046392424.1 uncharacterized protein LOC124160585 [Ischnura elegans]XP_046392425.1 uncharacterized protein LOC124160585 [Ischnura elegans]
MTRRPALASSKVRQVYDDLARELKEIEEVAHNVSLSAANNASNVDANCSDSEEKMDTSYGSDLLDTLDKELQQVCGKLACIIDSIGPVIPRSQDHAIQSYFMRLEEEIKNMKLINEKKGQQEKGFRDRIRLLQLQKNSLERAVIGAEKRLAADEEESKRADELLRWVHEEFARTRQDLHYVLSELFPDDGEDMKRLLAELTATRDSKDPEKKWTDLTPYVNAHVELLLREFIIELNPTDSKLGRFTI